MKGQADMPVELVIAVIIMIMSTALAFLLINQSNEDKCLAQLKTQTNVLQQAVLDVALASPPTSRTVEFIPIECGGKRIEALQFVYYSDPRFCSLCASRYGGCWQIIPVAKERVGSEEKFIPLYKSISCINMAGNVWIQDDMACTAADKLSLYSQPYPSGTDANSWGIPETVWSQSNMQTPTVYPDGTAGTYDSNPSRWQTARLEKNVKAYNIKLTKSAGAITVSGEEQGIINVCVSKIQ